MSEKAPQAPLITPEQIPGGEFEPTERKVVLEGTGETIQFTPTPLLRISEEFTVPDVNENEGKGIDLSRNQLLAVVKAGNNTYGIFEDTEEESPEDRYYISHCSTEPDNNGKRSLTPRKVYNVSPNETFLIGRPDKDDTDDKELQHTDKTISRKQANLTIGDNGTIQIEQLGKTNPTEITYAEAGGDPETVDHQGEGEDTTGTTEKDPIKAQLEQNIRDLDSKLHKIRTSLQDSEEQVLVWRYAAGMINKQEAQVREDGQESIIYGQEAGQAYNQLSPDARTQARSYLATMQKLHEARSELGKLRRTK